MTIRAAGTILRTPSNQVLFVKKADTGLWEYPGGHIEEGESDSRRIQINIGRLLGFEPAIRVDYIAIVDPQTLDEIKDIKGKVLVALAVRIGKTRLIDNMLISPK